MRKHFYAELQPWLQNNLKATKISEGRTQPAYPLRQNSFALLAERAELGRLGDPLSYFRENFQMFMTNNWTPAKKGELAEGVYLTRQQVKQLFGLPMSREAYREYKRLLETTFAEMKDCSGCWRFFPPGVNPALAMLEDLKAAQPLHAGEADQPR